MKPSEILLMALLAWAPGHAALAQTDGSKWAACLNTSALLAMNNANAVVKEGKTNFLAAPEIDGEAYVSELERLYAIPPGQVRYHAKLEDGEPLFVQSGTVLGAPGRMYALFNNDPEGGGCGFIRLSLRDRWMRTHREDGVWTLIDRASVTYANGAFEYLKIILEDKPTPSNPAHVYTLRHESFKCPGQVGLHRAIHMSEDGKGLKSYGFTGSNGEPSWGELAPDHLVPMQRFFCGNGADSRIATHFVDQAAALAAWRTENEN